MKRPHLPTHRDRLAGRSPETGIALLMVLWVLTVLMVIVLSFSFTAKTETLSTLSFREGIEKKFFAEAGIERAIAEMLYRKQNEASGDPEIWKVDGTAYRDQLGSGNYVVRITDESGKLDVNMLNDNSAIILKNLLINSGVSDDDANTIVDSVLDWKDADDLRRLNGAESDYYMSLQNPYKAKNADFDTLEELLQVKGMTAGILYGGGGTAGIINFLTVNSRVATINLNSAPRELLMAVPGMTAEIAEAIIQFRTEKEITGIPDVQAVLGEAYKTMAPYIGAGTSSSFTIDSLGYKSSEKKGYTIRATIVIESTMKARYVYYKGPVYMTP